MVPQLASLILASETLKPQPAPQPADPVSRFIPEIVKSIVEILRPICEVFYWQGVRDGFIAGAIAAAVVCGAVYLLFLRQGAK
jgi:hypothetical protein